MKPSTIKYYVSSAIRSLFRNRLMSFASIFTVASCIFIVSIFYILAANMGSVIEDVESQIGIVAFVDDDFPVLDLPSLANEIYNLPQVANIYFISQEEALTIMDDLFGEGSAMLDWVMIGGNPLRRAFHIELTGLQHHDDVYDALVAMQTRGIALVRSDTNLVRTVRTVSDVVQIVSLILIGMLGVISIIIIINTIRITVSARQTEINIMKYVGATDWFIRWPFVIEGILIGLIGGSIPALITRFGYNPLFERISNIAFLDFIEFLPGEYIFAYLIPFALTLGTAIGLVGSLISVRQHLRV